MTTTLPLSAFVRMMIIHHRSRRRIAVYYETCIIITTSATPAHWDAYRTERGTLKLPRDITRPQEFTLRSAFHVNDISSQDHHWTRALQFQISHAGFFFCSHVFTDFVSSSDNEETICKVSTLFLLPIRSSHRGMQGNAWVMCFCVFKMAPLFDQSRQSSSTFFFFWTFIGMNHNHFWLIFSTF